MRRGLHVRLHARAPPRPTPHACCMQVRSCTLDTWLPRQIEFVRCMGNTKANKYWEARLPPGFRRPSGANPGPELATFIRDKYQDRRYAADGEGPPTIDNYATHPYGGSNPMAAAGNGAAAAPGARSNSSQSLAGRSEGVSRLLGGGCGCCPCSASGAQALMGHLGREFMEPEPPALPCAVCEGRTPGDDVCVFCTRDRGSGRIVA